MVQNHLLENSRAINKLQDIVERTSNDVKILVKHFQMVQTQIDQLTKVQKYLIVNAAREKQACEICTRGGATTQDPLYPEGHTKGIEQDSQCNSRDNIPPKKKKKKHKTVAESSEAGKILTVFLFLMLKLNQVMLLIRKKLKRNQKSLLKMQSTPKNISLPTSMVMRENLGCRNQCLFLVRNINPRKKNTTTGFVNG
jgi:hypothetical protein